MTKKLIPYGIIAALLLFNMPVLADDPKPAEPEKPAATEVAKPDPVKSDDPVADAEGKIDDAIKDVDKDPGAQISWIIELAKSGRWGPFAGQLLLFLVWGLRKFIWKLIKPNVLPWVTLGAAMVASVAVGLIAGNVWWQVLIDGLITGGSAMALWSLLFKHFMKPKEEAKPA
jgi:hypothetical protein